MAWEAWFAIGLATLIFVVLANRIIEDRDPDTVFTTIRLVGSLGLLTGAILCVVIF